MKQKGNFAIRITHLPFGFYGFCLALSQLAYGSAPPKLPAHQGVADDHCYHRHQVCEAQEHQVVPGQIEFYSNLT